jgi:RNA 2',3'-cyclic 3'-phosphodiesterase
MRIFIAIALPKKVRKELSALQDRLKKSNTDIKWVKPENIHLTLQFLGNVKENRLAQIIQYLVQATEKHNHFYLSVKTLRVLPKLDYPRIIWVGINDEKQACKALQKSITENMEKLGFKKDGRAFLPHITLGRVRSDNNKETLIGLIKNEKDFSIKAKISVNKITLFYSLITQQGPVYSILEEFPLPEDS